MYRLNAIDEIYRKLYLEYWNSLGYSADPADSRKTEKKETDMGNFDRFYRRLYLKTLMEKGISNPTVDPKEYQEFLRGLPSDESRLSSVRDPEQTVIYRFFFRKYLKPHGVSEKNDEGVRPPKSSPYILSFHSPIKYRGKNKKEKGYTEPAEKAGKALQILYQDWEKEPSFGSSSNASQYAAAGIQKPDKMLMLMAAFNRYFEHRYEKKDGSEKETVLFFRFLLEYLLEHPSGYLTGHCGEKENSRFVKIAFLSPLLSSEDTSAKNPKETDSAENLNKRFLLLRNRLLDKTTVSEASAKLYRIPAEELRRLTDDILSASLNEKVKTFFKDMGFTHPEVVRLKKEENEDKIPQKRKADHTLELLRFYADREAAESSSIGTGGRDRLPSDANMPYFSEQECDVLLSIMNSAGKRSGNFGAFVPLMADLSGTMLCIMGWDLFISMSDPKDITSRTISKWKKEPYSYGVIGPEFGTDHGNNRFTDLLSDRQQKREHQRISYSYLSGANVKYQDFSDALAAYRELVNAAEPEIRFGFTIQQNEGQLLRKGNLSRDQIPAPFLPFFGFSSSREEEYLSEYEKNRQQLMDGEENYLARNSQRSPGR